MGGGLGQVLNDRYRVIREIGRGGMGEVYLVEHAPLGRLEALKVLAPRLAADAKLARRFRREARAANRVAHRNIVVIYDFGKLPDERLYIAMEYADGDRLDELLVRVGRLPVPRALEVAHQLAGAVDHAHACGVVHRDLKPSNLVLSESRGHADCLKVLDFGIAKIIEPGQQESLISSGHVAFGTPHPARARPAHPPLHGETGGPALFHRRGGRRGDRAGAGGELRLDVSRPGERDPAVARLENRLAAVAEFTRTSSPSSLRPAAASVGLPAPAAISA